MTKLRIMTEFWMAKLRINCTFVLGYGQDQAHEEAPPAPRPPSFQMPNMMDIGARKIFNEDQDIFRESVRKWVIIFSLNNNPINHKLWYNHFI